MRASALCLTIVLLLPAAAVMAGDWAPVIPGRSWSFPADHWSHPEYKTEWWYVTGHLEAANDPHRRFGFQFTFFRVGLLPEKPDLDSEWAAGSLIMAHASIIDAAGGKHWFSEVLWRDSPLFGGFGRHPDPLIAFCIGPAGTDSRWSLSRDGEGFRIRMKDRRQGMALDLRVIPEKPLVFQGPDGVSPKGEEPGAASYYYSYTRMGTTGSITSCGHTMKVTGSSWMDREFFTSELTGEQAGWDWFSIQLEDGRELMLYQLRNRDGTPDFGRGTMVAASGEPVYLDMKNGWQVQVDGFWESPETGIAWPSGWTLEIDDPGEVDRLRLEIRPLVPHQENISRRSGLSYWEGAVTVHPAGAAPDAPPIGRGYVELTGYGRNNRPPI